MKKPPSSRFCLLLSPIFVVFCRCRSFAIQKSALGRSCVDRGRGASEQRRRDNKKKGGCRAPHALPVPLAPALVLLVLEASGSTRAA